MAVIFPKITSLTVHGFRKIFSSEDFTVNFSKNLSMILGGNGLGKTTLLQCIVYALTGGTDNPNIEEKTSLRWSNDYFKGKVDEDAYVCVYFYFGLNLLSIKRGFNSTRVLRCTITIGEGKNEQECTLEEAICEYGNYNSYEDFAFIINRLLYLPESRRSLLWDYDAQIRALMILNNEFVAEDEYRLLRQRIKEKDSNKRKLRWDINRIEKHRQLKAEEVSIETIKDEYKINKAKRENLLVALKDKSNLNKQLYEQIKKDEDTRNQLIKSVSEIAQQVQQAEAEHIKELLLSYDHDVAVIWNKTIENGYCPACDQKSNEFKDTIIERLNNGRCLTCGQSIGKYHKTTEIDIMALNSQLNEKIIARNTLDVRITQAKNKLIEVDEEIATIRNELSIIDYGLIDEIANEDDEDDFINASDEFAAEQEYLLMRQKEEELEVEIAKLTRHADSIYKEFIANFENRCERLYKEYSDLASKFLGVSVQLNFIQSKAKFVNMKYLVPVFNDVIRDSPDTCSEAQRFFLDIAFRMSIIALNKSINNLDSTFICETPENALDVSYIDNVVKMFIAFMMNGGNLILTNNLQLLGIAQALIKSAKSNNVSVDIFDLLKYGKLSDIQNNSPTLKDIRDEIIAEVIK